VRTFAHVTGGGLAANLARVLPPQADAVLDRASWLPAPVFGLLAERGNVEAQEMERTFNMGVGMVAVVSPEDADRALGLLDAVSKGTLDGGHGAPSPGGGLPDETISAIIVSVVVPVLVLVVLIR
jgi:phosphoribosylformylglycinamidine cyclo-ligase